MGASQAMYIKSGEQPRSFIFGNQTVPLLSITTNQNSLPLYKESVFSTFQAWIKGTGALTATINFDVSNDDLTGRGWVFDNRNAPGILVTTTNASATLTAAGGNFPSGLTGLEVRGPGITPGTTVSSVAAGGATLTLSGNATASATVQANFYDQNWCTTVLGTITLSGTYPTGTSDGFTTTAPWRYVRARVSNITGTGCTCYVFMGC